MPRSAHSRDYRKFRSYLRSLREDAGLSQKDVAKALGAHQSFVSKYESGERRLDVIELRKVCAALGMSPATFMRRLDKLLSS